ncbi:MAG: SH3 domain-containing protein [Chthoniobacterales bacterium]
MPPGATAPSSFTTPQNPSASASPAFPSPTPATALLRTCRIVNIAAGDTLNVRAGPGSTYGLVARLRPGTRGIVFGSSRAANGSTIWQQIIVGRYTGWVNEIYLEPETTPR